MIPILPIHEPVVLEIQAEINETQSTIIKTLDSGHRDTKPSSLTKPGKLSQRTIEPGARWA
jgi:hypothetical protein